MIAKNSPINKLSVTFLRHRPQNWIVRNRRYFYILELFLQFFNLASISVDMVIKLALFNHCN
jgi:hypothetical protein